MGQPLKITTSFSSSDRKEAQTRPEDLKELAVLLARHAPYDGHFNITDDGIHIVRASHIEKAQSYTLSQPGICLVPQGAKCVSLIDGSFEYGETTMVVYAASVPINVQITKASPEAPFLCLVLPIDAAKLSDLILKAFPNGVPKTTTPRAVYFGETTPNLVKSATRLMQHIALQEDADLLVPLALEEVLIRLLRSPAGANIAQIGIKDSHAEKVSKAILWLKENYTKAIKVEKLAQIAGMSLSSFHIHFKEVTSLSPVQYQKTLRLQQARFLIKTQHTDISHAAFKVGYSSSSQFSREYSREFGISPSKDQSGGESK